MSSLKYGFIDSIRGIAILMVILVHTSQSLTLPEGWLQLVSSYGQMGVQLFFVASAYTLCLTFEKRGREDNALANFYIRRFFRIAPIYYLGILCYFLLRTFEGYLKVGQVAIPEQYTAVNVLANFAFINGLYEPANNNIVPGGWSIGTEMLFYLVFPFFMALTSKFLTRKIWAISLPFIVVVSSISIWELAGYSVTNNDFLYFSILNQSSVFAVGISLYFIHTYHAHLISHVGLAKLVMLTIGLSILSLYVGWIRYVEQAFILVPFLAAASFLFLVEIFKRINSNKLQLLQKIGQRSYSMYIMHFVFAHQVSGVINKKLFIEHIGSELSLVVCYLMTV
ncbi:MAG: acyltransferase, partial [Colwellia sp.]